MYYLGALLCAQIARAADFTVIALPDTQFYACTGSGSCAGELGIYESQLDWIAANRDILDIRFVTSVGDCVQNANRQEQFQVADEAFRLLEQASGPGYPDGIPYGIAVGNNDQFPASSPGSIPSVLDVLHPSQGSTTVLFNETFGLDRFCPGSLCRSYYGDHFGINNDNHYDLFSAGPYDFVIVHLEYMPSDAPLRRAVLAWADEVLTRHSDRRAIVVSHYLMAKGTGGSFSNQGAAVYEALKRHENLFLMLAGHIAGEGRRADTFQGRTVNTLLSDYQSRDDGGEGWLRILQFHPESDTISVQTYSPWLDEFETDSSSQFTLSYDMSGGHPDARASFQQGTDGYSGAMDTWLAPSTGPHGADTALSWGSGAVALLRFGSLFDTEGGPIPQGAHITEAVLHTVFDETSAPATLHALSSPWSDSADETALGSTPGAQSGEDYDPLPVAQIAGGLRVAAIDVTASVQAWSDDPALNNGWIFVSSGAAARLRSGDHLDPADRPRLSVRYRDDSAPFPRQVRLTDIERAWVSSASPSTRFVGVEVDTASAFKHAFLKPVHLGDLAPGDVISQAKLVLRVVDAGDPVQLREVLSDWSTSTLSYNNVPATSAPLTTFPGSVGEVTVDVTALVQRWVDGAPAYGLNLYPTGSNGVDIGEISLQIDLLDIGDCVDADGDGHADSACGGRDCDDSDPGVHPGAPEVCDDEIDHDCSGALECESAPRTILLTELDDAWVSSASPQTNMGNSPTLEVDTASTFKRAFLKPVHLGDLAPGDVISQAKLVLRVVDSGDRVEVREVLSSWQESTLTWSNAPATSAAFTSFPGSKGEITVDVTALVQRWVDGAPVYGVNLQPTGSNGVDLSSTESSNSAARPYLVVEVLP